MSKPPPKLDAAAPHGLVAQGGTHVALVDHERTARTGFPEVVLGQWKRAEDIVAILREMATRGPAIATRVSAAQAAMITEAWPACIYHEVARVIVAPSPFAAPAINGVVVAVVAAGTSDLPVAEEAAVVAAVMGLSVTRSYDVGVAGISRLFAALPELAQADIIIAVAGMEGALPSVLAGLVAAPMIALPTSVGYGVGAEGLAALSGMLSSCAPGLTVVNIDNGFGAALAAGRMARMLAAARAPT